MTNLVVGQTYLVNRRERTRTSLWCKYCDEYGHRPDKNIYVVAVKNIYTSQPCFLLFGRKWDVENFEILPEKISKDELIRRFG